jgi:RNA polymerase sigma-70 factor, ECF subfamily
LQGAGPGCYCWDRMEAARAFEAAVEQVSFGAAEEAQLVAELKAGSEEAFAYVLDRYGNPIYSLVAHILGSDVDAGDVLQNVFVKVFRGIGQFHHQSALKTWVYRIAVREALNFRRGWFRRHFHEPFSIDDEPGKTAAARFNAQPADGPYESLEQSERQRLVKAALDALPRTYRAVLVLREMEELPYDEIASVLGVPEGTVKSRVMRGRELLRRKLATILGC